MRTFDRREFGLSLAGAAAASLLRPGLAFAAEPPPETGIVRLPWLPAICLVPIYVLEQFIRAEGFSEVRYVRSQGGGSTAGLVAEGQIDMSATFAGQVAYQLDTGLPITALGGLHVGCYELFAHEPVENIRDLKGRKVGVGGLVTSDRLYLSIMARNIGLDPKTDIIWVPNKGGKAVESFVAGETDAYLGFPPVPQQLRSRGVNRVILNTTLDHPWSQYFCCMLYANSDWVRRHPVATKRFLRAVYRAADLCTSNPAMAARRMVEGGFEKNYDHALETIESVPFDRWHDYDSEDTLRFYALRLHEAGMLKNNPNALIEKGADWSFLNELKREMKT